MTTVNQSSAGTSPRVGRLRAAMEFFAAILYFLLARSIAQRGADGLVSDAWSPLAAQAMLVFLLILGYAVMGFWLDRQTHPISVQGLPARPGWPAEAGLGLAVGWGIAVVCLLPLTLAGGIAITLSTQSSAWGWLAVNAAFFALLALAEEVAFRGYGFQSFTRVVGPFSASIVFALFYAIVQAFVLGASRASFAVSIALGLVFSTAYLRTRALWLSWGINFAWKASRALLFGLAISGDNSHSPVVQGDPMGPFWLTGGGFGLDGTWITFLVLLAALLLVYRITRELDFRYNAPVIVPGGIPVDLDAASRAQHEAATRPAEPAAPALIQILPVSAPPRPIEIPDSQQTPPSSRE